MNRDEKLALISRYFYKSSKADLWFGVLENTADGADTVLEIGSGSGAGKQNQNYPDVKTLVGLDLDPRVIDNPFLKQAQCMSAYDLTEDSFGMTFDCIYSHMVAEHIDDGEKFIVAQLGVLKDGGALVHSTVSKYYWVSMINNFVPSKAKAWLIKHLGSGREDQDIFPAHYKLNSAHQIKKICKTLKLDCEFIRQDEPPGYLRRSLVLMVIYSLVHKPLQLLFPALRPTFVFVVKRRNGGSDA